jgi:hypothetical protein
MRRAMEIMRSTPHSAGKPVALWRLLLAGAGCILPIVIGCADLGNGSEITNGVISLRGVATENGTPRAGVLVTAFETSYIPLWAYNARPVRVISDSVGGFSIPLSRAVHYNVHFSDTAGNRGAFKKNIVPDTDNCSLGSIELDSLGAISGAICGDTAKTHSYNVFVAGSPFFAKVTGNNGFFIPEIPAETYNLSVTVFQSDAFMIVVHYPSQPFADANDPRSPPIIGSRNIKVAAGATARIDSLKVAY